MVNIFCRIVALEGKFMVGVLFILSLWKYTDIPYFEDVARPCVFAIMVSPLFFLIFLPILDPEFCEELEKEDKEESEPTRKS